MDLGLDERRCVVTGGSGGVGAEVGRKLCAEGADVLLVGRDGERLADAAAACGGSAQTLALDLTAADAGDRVVGACTERFGGVDVVVNGAGMTAVTAIDELSDDDWQAHWELHVMAPMRLMRAAIPAMVHAGWGRVVNVSSSSGKRPGQRNVAYSVTKAALLSLSRAYADAYAGAGVLVNAVTPGPLAGDLWLAPGGLVDQTVAARGGTREQVLQSAAAGLPVRRLGEPEEIADVIVFLCSAAASNVAGAAWSVDGGAVPVIIWGSAVDWPLEMTVNSEAIGKRYEPTTYAVGREKIVEFALATGETEPLHLDAAAARAAGYADVVAPPMFAVVYQRPSLTQALFDPELGIDFAHLVHGEQAFRWERVVVAGEELTTTLTVSDISSKMDMGFFVFAVESVDERGETVCTGLWTNIVRPAG